ncbi:MAG: hypothetical protein IPL46_26620 [Saprospiraceae bacterium]|nr:hypothetical protein [Saprospiraceae bacterium]
MDIHTKADLTQGNKQPTEEPRRQPAIQLTKLHHQGIDHIALRFNHNISIKEHIQQLEFLRWTKTHRCFYMANDWKEVRILVNHCRGKIWVDLTQLGKKTGKEISSKHEEHLGPGSLNAVKPIKADIQAKIEDVRRWMEQKRYGASTVKTYLSFIKHFFGRHPALHWDGITKEIITSYNHQYFIRDKRSTARRINGLMRSKFICMYIVSIWVN